MIAPSTIKKIKYKNKLHVPVNIFYKLYKFQSGFFLSKILEHTSLG